MAPVWKEVRPPLLVGLGLTVLVLGTVGFEQVPEHNYGFLDALYRAITLFAFGSGAVEPPVPLALQVARILGPLLTGYAAVGTILALSRAQAQIAGIRLFAREHVIVAGLGASGSCLALALDDRDVRVVIVESNPTNTRLAGVRGVDTGALEMSISADIWFVLRKATRTDRGIADAPPRSREGCSPARVSFCEPRPLSDF